MAASRGKTETEAPPDLLACWQQVLDCKCNTSKRNWCSKCCDAFGAIGDALSRKCPVCGGVCELKAVCPTHE
jgi:hypothetical protein